MSASTTSHGQSGFMSVESIGNALFYLIMLGIASLIVSVVMNTGKGGGDMSAISMVRSNVQYVGTSAGSYTGVDQLKLSEIVSLISESGSDYILPSGHKISTIVNPDSPSRFNIKIENTDPAEFVDRDLCRKYAYNGVGSGFYEVSVKYGANTEIITASNMIEGAEDGCGNPTDAPAYVTLISN